MKAGSKPLLALEKPLTRYPRAGGAVVRAPTRRSASSAILAYKCIRLTSGCQTYMTALYTGPRDEILRHSDRSRIGLSRLSAPAVTTCLLLLSQFGDVTYGP